MAGFDLNESNDSGGGVNIENLASPFDQLPTQPSSPGCAAEAAGATASAAAASAAASGVAGDGDDTRSVAKFAAECVPLPLQSLSLGPRPQQSSGPAHDVTANAATAGDPYFFLSGAIDGVATEYVPSGGGDEEEDEDDDDDASFVARDVLIEVKHRMGSDVNRAPPFYDLARTPFQRRK